MQNKVAGLLFAFIIITLSQSVLVAQKKSGNKLPEGYFQGFYSDGRSLVRNQPNLRIQATGKNKYEIRDSIFGHVKLQVRNKYADTIRLTSDQTNIEAKYSIKTKKLVLLQSRSDGFMRYIGTYRYRDEADLKRKQEETQLKIDRRKETTPVYGVFAGTIYINGQVSPVPDTVIVYRLKKDVSEGDFLIEDHYAVFESKSKRFERFESQIKLWYHNNNYTQYKSKYIVFTMDPGKNTLDLSNSMLKMKFKGVKIADALK